MALILDDGPENYYMNLVLDYSAIVVHILFLFEVKLSINVSIVKAYYKLNANLLYDAQLIFFVIFDIKVYKIIMSDYEVTIVFYITCNYKTFYDSQGKK